MTEWEADFTVVTEANRPEGRKNNIWRGSDSPRWRKFCGLVAFNNALGQRLLRYEDLRSCKGFVLEKAIERGLRVQDLNVLIKPHGFRLVRVKRDHKILGETKHGGRFIALGWTSGEKDAFAHWIAIDCDHNIIIDCNAPHVIWRSPQAILSKLSVRSERHFTPLQIYKIQTL